MICLPSVAGCGKLKQVEAVSGEWTLVFIAWNIKRKRLLWHEKKPLNSYRL